jgi:hypothetical protein
MSTIPGTPCLGHSSGLRLHRDLRGNTGLPWPDRLAAYTTFTNIETAFMDVMQRVGGSVMFRAMAVLLVIANIGGGLTG